MAKKQREASEAARPKYVLEEDSASHCRPAAYYISQAREKHLHMLHSRPKSALLRVFTPAKNTIRAPNSPVSPAYRQSDSPRSPSKSPHNASFLKEITDALPDWVLERSDFLPSYSRIKEGAGINLFEVCRLPRVQRKEAELNALIQWTLSIPFFAGLPRTVLKDLCGKFQGVVAAKDTVSKLYAVMRQGEAGDYLLVVYSGVIETSVDGVVTAAEGEKALIGSEALGGEVIRTTTVTAKTDTTMLKLTQTDYDCVLLGVRNKEKHDLTEFLKAIPYFSTWQLVKLHRLSSIFTSITLNPGQCFYQKGNQSSSFYIVKSGKVDIQTLVDLAESRRWPVGSHAWEISNLAKKVLYRLKTCGPGGMFGDLEMVLGKERATRAKAVVKTTCLAVSREEFFKIFTQRETEMLAQYTNLALPSEKELVVGVTETFANQRATVTDR
jgi:CRP-like cAMP-binding protein